MSPFKAFVALLICGAIICILYYVLFYDIFSYLPRV
jgi:uncharacterized RDD family membrane protein YckC